MTPSYLTVDSLMILALSFSFALLCCHHMALRKALELARREHERGRREEAMRHRLQTETLEVQVDLAVHALRAILEKGALAHTTASRYEPRTPCDCDACKAVHNAEVVFRIGEFARPVPDEEARFEIDEVPLHRSCDKSATRIEIGAVSAVVIDQDLLAGCQCGRCTCWSRPAGQVCRRPEP